MNQELLQALEGFVPTTKTKETQQSYMRRAQQLMDRAKLEKNIPHNQKMDVRQFATWLVDLKPKLSRSSWRQYKSAVVFYLEQHPETHESIEALSFLKEVTSLGAIKRSQRTSALKLKRIPMEDWEKLDAYLQKKPGKWGEPLRHWLRSSIITGLRPSEWQNTKLTTYQGEDAIEVKNAKNTNGRSHGETRILLLKNMSKEDMDSLRQHINNVLAFDAMDGFEKFHISCSSQLHRVCRKLWPRRKKHISLYSTRHQFSANAKSSGFSKAEVAAMMGHAVDITATAHYGRKVAGNEELSILPTGENVARIKNIETSYSYKSSSGASSVAKAQTKTTIANPFAGGPPPPTQK